MSSGGAFLNLLSGNAAPFSPTDIANIAAWWDFTDSTTNTADGGGLLLTSTDKSGNGKDLGRAFATAPAYNPATGLTFTGTSGEQLTAGSAGDWNMLHDGTGGSVFYVFEKTSNTGNIQAIVWTGSTPGTRIGVNNTAATGSGAQTHGYTVWGSSAIINTTCTGFSAPLNRREVYGVKLKDDGTTVDVTAFADTVREALLNGNASGAFSSSNSGAIFIGAQTFSASKFIGILREVIVYDRDLTDAEMTQVQYYLGIKHGIINKALDVYLIMGQSNAGELGTLPAVCATRTFNQNESISRLIFKDAQAAYAGFTTWFNYLRTPTGGGVEIPLGIQLVADKAKQIAFCKYQVDTTSLASDWASDGATWIAAKAAINASISELQSYGFTPTVKGIIWLQGEEDGRTGNDALAAAYGTNLTAFITRVRSEITGAASAKFITPAVKTDGTGNFSISLFSTINTAKSTVCGADGNALYIPDNSWTLIDDVHLDMAALVDIGETAAAAL